MVARDLVTLVDLHRVSADALFGAIWSRVDGFLSHNVAIIFRGLYA